MTPDQKRIEEIRERINECNQLCKNLGVNPPDGPTDFLLRQLDAAREREELAVGALKRLTEPMTEGDIQIDVWEDAMKIVDRFEKVSGQ